MNLIFEKKLIIFALFISLTCYAETIQEQYDAIQNGTTKSLNILNHEFFDKLNKNIQCTASQPILLNEKEDDYDNEKIHIQVKYQCILNPFDTYGLDGFTAIKGNDYVDLKEDGNIQFNEKIVDEYFNRIKNNYVVIIQLNGTKYQEKLPFFHSNYTENIDNIILHAENMEGNIEFEIPKQQIGLIKDSSITIKWINENPSEILNNIGFLKQEDVNKVITRKIKSATQTYYTLYNCAASQEVKNMEDMKVCTLATMVQAFGGSNRYYNFSQGKKVLFPVDKKTFGINLKSHLSCLANLAKRRFKSEKEIDLTEKKECSSKDSDIFKLSKQ